LNIDNKISVTNMALRE